MISCRSLTKSNVRRPEQLQAEKFLDSAFGVTAHLVENSTGPFYANPPIVIEAAHSVHWKRDLRARGLSDFVTFDPRIVRGLAYYTGVVFEVFDRGQKSRALAGGGRYDELIGTLSDGAVRHPALGFAVGDVTLLDLLRELPHTAALLDAAVRSASAPEVYVVVADEAFRPQALGLVGELRAAGRRVDFALTAAKVGKQFQAAEAMGARHAAVVGQRMAAGEAQNARHAGGERGGRGGIGGTAGCDERRVTGKTLSGQAADRLAGCSKRYGCLSEAIQDLALDRPCGRTRRLTGNSLDRLGEPTLPWDAADAAGSGRAQHVLAHPFHHRRASAGC